MQYDRFHGWAKKPESWRALRMQYDRFHGWAKKPDNWHAFRIIYDRFHGWAKRPDSWWAFRMQYDRFYGWAKSQTVGAPLECNITVWSAWVGKKINLDFSANASKFESF